MSVINHGSQFCLLATQYVHDIDPYLFKFPDGFGIGPVDGIRWYGLSYLVGFIVAGLMMKLITRAGRSTVPSSSISDMIVALAIGAVVGGRVGYVLFYKPELLTQWGEHFPYWGAIAVNQGGMASHGGIIGALVACYWLAKRGTVDRDQLKKLEAEKQTKITVTRIKHSFLHILDLATYATPIGLCFGRIANFINGELFGRPTSPDNPLAVRFPTELDSPKYWAVEKFESLTEVAEKLGYDKSKYADMVQAAINGDYKAEHFLRSEFTSQVIMASQSEVDLGINPLLAQILTPRHPSQLYQALLEGLSLAIILFLLWRKPRKPGIICGTFLLGYGIFRIAAEQFREPDAHLDLFLGLTRGQWLSLVMPVAGIVMLIRCAKRDVDAVGGMMPATQIKSANNTD